MRQRQFFLIALTILLVLVTVALVVSARNRSVPSAFRAMQTSSSEGSVLASLAANTFRVTHVVDGDTVDVTDTSGTKHRVRFIGIDTPETVDSRKKIQCYGPEASARMKALLTDKVVTLERKPDEDKDDYGRLLRYVFLGSTDIGAEMLSEGYARSLCPAFPHPKCAAYDALELAAKTAGVGRWEACR